MDITSMASQNPPQVKIFYHPKAKEQLRQVQYGLEEEGIPFSSEEWEEYSSIERLSFVAAEASTLGVGLGLEQDGTIALHYYRLQSDSPLFLLPGKQYTSTLGRAMGSNAARLVKGNPFKALDEEEEIDSAEEELVKIVTKLVYQILQEGKN